MNAFIEYMTQLIKHFQVWVLGYTFRLKLSGGMAANYGLTVTWEKDQPFISQFLYIGKNCLKKLLDMAKTILVVDDDEEILEGFTAMLESGGYIVHTASDAKTLLHLSTNTLPDLIILDVLLSGIDGRVMCKRLKKQKITKYIPFIMISAAPNVEQSVKEAQADDYLSKPFEMDKLFTIVKRYIGTAT